DVYSLSHGRAPPPFHPFSRILEILRFCAQADDGDQFLSASCGSLSRYSLYHSVYKRSKIMGKRRLNLLPMVVFLLAAALSIFAAPAGAQPDQPQYVVIYMELTPADTKAGGQVLDDLASQGLASVGVIRFDVLQQVDRRN